MAAGDTLSRPSRPGGVGSIEAVGRRRPVSTAAESDPGRRDAASAAPGRLASIDVVRGAVIVLMALDHVRQFFTDAAFAPEDLTQTNAALFLTRWITHYCAPNFVLLAGLSAWLAGRRRTPGELSRFLLARGLWLVALELTVVNFGWYFTTEFAYGIFAQVIWAIGWSMVALAGLVHLPRAALVAVTLAIISGHNLLDGIEPAALGAFGPLWTVLHVMGPIEGTPLFGIYPVLPWIGVMAAGYLLGSLWEETADRRRRTLYLLGAAGVIAFIVLRALNVYGDPVPWTDQADATLTALSFLNTAKYPPSLLFLLMTIGPALLALAWLESRGGRWIDWLCTLGRVPLFFYVVHLYAIHALAVVAGVLLGFPATAFLADSFDFPAEYGFGLAGVYAVWVTVMIGLYPLCRAYGEWKRRGTGWWWSYL